MEIIRETLKDIAGELHEQPWVNFGYNRTQALQYALGSPSGDRPPKGDYIFVLDADHTVGFAEGFELPRLEADSYDIEIRYGNVAYPSKRLVRGDLPWRNVGVLPAFISCNTTSTHARL